MKKSPPLVPSFLIDSMLAFGPPGIFWVAPATVWTVVNPWVFWITPVAINTIANTNEIGSRMRNVVRTRSTQKLPIVVLPARQAADQRDHHRHSRRRRTRSSGR